MRLRKYFALEEPRRAGTFDECIKVHSSGLDFQPARYINPSFTAPRDFPATRRNASSRLFASGYEFQEIPRCSRAARSRRAREDARIIPIDYGLSFDRQATPSSSFMKRPLAF